MKALRDLRTKNKYTLKQVAQHTKMSLKTVYRHERGESSVALDQAAKYAVLYGISLDALYEMEGTQV